MTNPGDLLRDPDGVLLVVVEVTSGKMPTPINTSAPSCGSSAETCALYGGRAHDKHQIKEKP